MIARRQIRKKIGSEDKRRSRSVRAAKLKEERLSALREMAAAEWSQKRMAAALGIHQTMVSVILNANDILHRTKPGRLRTPKADTRAHPIMRELRRARVKRGLTQRQLARTCGYHPSQITEYETGYRTISLPAVANLANALGFNLRLMAADQ